MLLGFFGGASAVALSLAGRACQRRYAPLRLSCWVYAWLAVGLMAAVVVVYGLVALRSDVDRYTAADTEAAIARAAKAAEESPLVLQAVTAPIGLGAPGAGTQTEVAGAAIGWRISF